MTWLDSTSCSVDMQLRTGLGLHVTLPIITSGIAVGYGGLGIVRSVAGSEIVGAEVFRGSVGSKRVYVHRYLIA